MKRWIMTAIDGVDRRVDRRTFLGSATAASVSLGAGGLKAAAPSQTKVVGIQIPAVSFVDEGTEQVLDIVQSRARVNAIYIPVFAFNDGLAGRQLQGQPLPDHGKQVHNYDFHGGYFATQHPRFYEKTVFKAARAPDHGAYDVLADVLPRARRRGLKVIAFLADNWKSGLPNGDKLIQVALSGRQGNTVCFHNPEYRAFHAAIIEDCVRSYPELDGVLWRSEKQGPVSRVLAINHYKPAEPYCFCGFCEAKAKAQGIDVARAREGYGALNAFAEAGRRGVHPVDGSFTGLWRLMIDFPEILQWESLQNQGLRECYEIAATTVKSARPRMASGTALGLSHSYNPVYRAAQDVQALARHNDFVKVTAYDNVAGERLAKYAERLGESFLAEMPAEERLSFTYRTMGFDGPPFAQLAERGLPASYITAEAKRMKAGAKGTGMQILMGIDGGLPSRWEAGAVPPQRVYEAVHAAFAGDADGVIISRKYSEIMLDNLSAAGRAVAELGIG